MGNNLKVIVSLIVVLIFVFVVFIGPVSFALVGESNSIPSSSEPAKEIYMQNCARCHGADGCSTTALGKTLKSPDLTVSKVQKRNDQRLTKSIEKGRGNMPAFGKKLSKEEITALIGYVRSLKN